MIPLIFQIADTPLSEFRSLSKHRTRFLRLLTSGLEDFLPSQLENDSRHNFALIASHVSDTTRSTAEPRDGVSLLMEEPEKTNGGLDGR